MTSLTAIDAKHPDWDTQNKIDLNSIDNLMEYARMEVFLEAPCVICHHEMGEHEWSNDSRKFICPKSS